jgi:hypothetical protein
MYRPKVMVLNHHFVRWGWNYFQSHQALWVFQQTVHNRKLNCALKIGSNWEETIVALQYKKRETKKRMYCFTNQLSKLVHIFLSQTLVLFETKTRSCTLGRSCTCRVLVLMQDTGQW